MSTQNRFVPHGRTRTSRWCCRLAVLLAICSRGSSAWAEPVTCLEIHPTAQLIANLERVVREKPEEARERTAFIAKGPRTISPVIIPLRAGATLADLIAPAARVSFDLDGFGARTWSWITPDAGWLVFDPRGTGRITSGLQLFGNVTFWLFWNTGCDALRALDDDGNGVLRGDELVGLAVWRDANADGVSQPGEVRSLSSLGIVELSTKHLVEDENDDVLAYAPGGVLFNDGSARTTYDVLLHAR